MRRRHALYALVGALGLVFAVRPSSHELYLLGLPGLAPAKGAATKLVAKSEIYQVRPGSEVRLVLRDSTVVAGTFLGTTLLPAEEWTTRYAAARESLLADGPFPAIGDTVEAHRRHEIPVRGSLEGFGFRTVVVRRQVPGTLHEVPFEDLLLLDGETWNVPRVGSRSRPAGAACRAWWPSSSPRPATPPACRRTGSPW